MPASNSKGGRCLPHLTPPPPHTVVSSLPHLCFLPSCRRHAPPREPRWMLTSINCEQATLLVVASSVCTSWGLHLGSYSRATIPITTLPCRHLPRPWPPQHRRGTNLHTWISASAPTSLQQSFDIPIDGAHACNCQHLSVAHCKAFSPRACVHMHAAATHARGPAWPSISLLMSSQTATTCGSTIARTNILKAGLRLNIISTLINLVTTHANGQMRVPLQ